MPIRVFKSTAFAPISPNRVRFSGFDYRSFPIDGVVFTPPDTLVTSRVLLVGGGGGAALGGGSGGQVIELIDFLLDLPSYSIVIGDGGLGAIVDVGGTKGSDGSSTTGFGQTALGGVGGANTCNNGQGNGKNGYNGSGGGGCSSGTTTGGTGTSGNNGGGNGGFTGSPYPGGGGAGSGEDGHDATGNSAPGRGGDGLESDITGTPIKYGPGGGAVAYLNETVFGVGGDDGGGDGGNNPTTGPGLDGRGAGGGGRDQSQTGWKGGKGIVIVRYTGAPRFTGGTITTVGSDTLHTFTSSGSLTAI